jgi:glycosyltransferase involved in cell wall biosynthesis
MTSIKYAFNGRFVVRKQTGQERFASELLRELDKICRKDEFELVVPEYAERIPEYQNIKVVKFGRVKGHFWEQISFYRYLRKHHLVSVNLTTTCPLLSAGIVCIHDAAYFEIQDMLIGNIYGKLSAVWHHLMINAAKHSKYPLLTVSNYSREHLAHFMKQPIERYHVISNAWQHFARIKGDEAIFEKLPKDFKRGEYFMALSSLSPHKNFIWVKEVAKRNPEKKFIIVGHAEGKTQHGSEELAASNIFFTGYLTDGEVKALMSECRAFIHPAIYEGFGIPPMEAMSCGAELIVSTASCLPEVYRQSAHYINPYDYEVDLDKLLKEPISPASEVLDAYSWKKEAAKLLNILRS